MRLDKFLASSTDYSRSQINRIIKQGQVLINDEVAPNGKVKITKNDCIVFDGEEIAWVDEGLYFMINKDIDVICSTDDDLYQSVFDYFDYPLKNKLHCVGRLDVDTTGLVILTDDGQFSHRITSPKHKVEKCYLVTLADPIEDFYQQEIEKGILLRGEKTATLPATMKIIDDYNCYLTITEGRYHQVKRMFAALGNKVTALHRHSIGKVVLDDNLDFGEYRSLTDEEIAGLIL